MKNEMSTKKKVFFSLFLATVAMLSTTFATSGQAFADDWHGHRGGGYGGEHRGWDRGGWGGGEHRGWNRGGWGGEHRGWDHRMMEHREWERHHRGW